MKSFEVLAPVGNMDMLYAAIAGGADAVYLAGTDFGARAYADNFSLDELSDVIKICHLYNVKAYITVNTLIKENEIQDVLEYINNLYNIDVDAIIIQDLGLAKLVVELFPDLEIHASTQISANSVHAVNYLSEIGFSRVVLARELSLDQIKEIAENSKIELEVFAHGSLCVSYSGKCLMSSMIGGRSGNRGRCAQPCRKKYDLTDPTGKIILKDKLLISPMDLGLLNQVKNLSDLDVTSVKIEGRLKKPEYVYSTALYYSMIKNDKNADENLVKEVSNRGFTKGPVLGSFGKKYVDFNDEAERGNLVGKISKTNKLGISLIDDVFERDTLEIKLESKKYSITVDKNYKRGEFLSLESFQDAIIDSPVYRISSSRLREMDFKKMLKDKSIKVSMKLRAYVGEHAELELYSKGKMVIVKSENIIEEGKSRKVDYDYAFGQISKLGETFFDLKNLEVETDGISFLSNGDLNALRRNGIMKIRDEICNWHRRSTKIDYSKSKTKVKRHSKKLEIVISIRKLNDEIINNKYVNKIYLRDLNGLENFELKGKKIYYELPPMANEKLLHDLAREIELKLSFLSGVVVNNAWEMKLTGRFPSLDIVYGIGTNVFNTETIENFSHKDEFKSVYILSPELSIEEISDITRNTNKRIGVMAYGRIDEMILYHCPASVLGCNKVCEDCKYSSDHIIKYGSDKYIFERVNNITRLRNALPISGLEHMRRFKEIGIDEVLLVLDKPNEMTKVIDIFSNAIINEKLTDKMVQMLGTTKAGHFKRGVK
ncbi:peptidase U32 family protein [Microaceticoccus formicicus]|uniref:peptidase U32 family protein n=1 Tax=Microaceticoccus formicicus TaxID=3118105 RepID=UPI003CD00C25|nr:DUF3656 domain-containing protein [Peptoniphilaceae bacterium AMB_02]